MDVTDILRDRMREPGGFQRMVTLSLAAHVAVATVAVLAPRGFFGHPKDTPREVMTISLAGSGAGPANGGFTTVGGRPVQEQTPPDEPPKREAIRPPAAKAPEMTLPAKNAKPAKATKSPDVKQAPDEARGRTPTKGKEVVAGTAVADTGVRGQGFGLSTGGGPGSGSTLDVADFCCPEYLMLMVEKIRSNWNARAGSSGEVMVVFTIDRDGRIGGVAQETSSGNAVLDLNAMRALVATRQLLPLPSAFPNPSLTVHLNFQYTR